jgi:integrase
MPEELEVFDYTSKNGKFPLGRSVDASIRRIETLLSDYLTSEQLAVLHDFASSAAAHDVRAGSQRRDVHPLNSVADASPVYTSLAQHDINNTLAVHTHQLTRLPQALLVLDYFGILSLAKGDIKAISEFCRRISKTSNPNAAQLASIVPATQDSQVFLTSVKALDDWQKQKKLSSSEEARRTEYRRVLRLWIKQLGLETQNTDQPPVREISGLPTTQAQILDALQPGPSDPEADDEETAKPRETKTKGKPKHTRVKHIRDDPTEGSDSHEAVPAQSLIVGEEESSPHLLKALAHHGHHARLNKMHAGSSDESFSKQQAELAIEFLLRYHGDSNAERVASLVWKLVAITGHHFDDLLNCLTGGKLKESKTLDSIFRSGGEVHWVSHHLIGERLPDPSRREETLRSFTLKACLPPSEYDDGAWQLLAKSIANDAFIDEILTAKKHIRKVARKQPGLGEFTESKLRGSLLQSVFSLDYDLPLTQLMFGERIQHSAAALHYIAWDQRALQNALNLALYGLYGERLPSPRMDTQRITVGAPKANTSADIFRQAREWFNICQEVVQQPLGIKNREEKHNTFAQTSMHLLGVSTAHRQTNDLRTLRVGDLYLDKGLVLYRDKPSDSAVYRRLACIPTQAGIYLSKYLYHLRVLLEQAHRKGLPAVEKQCQEALTDSGPIFFLIRGEECLDIEPPSELLTQHGMERDDCNMARHLQSTQLRTLGASPLLIEAHLGHHIFGPLFSNAGFVSAEEFADALRPYLDTWLDTAGYKPAKHITAEVLKIDRSGFDFKAMVAEEQAADTALFRSQARKQLSESLSIKDRSELIHTAIGKVVSNYAKQSPPRKISLSNDELQTIRNLVGGADYSNLINLQRTFRKLLLVLNKLRSDYEWTFESPPSMVLDVKQPLSITRGHLAAASFCNDIKQSLIDDAKDSPVFDDHLALLKSLLLWGQAKNLDEARAIAEAIKGDRYQPINLSYVVNLKGSMKDSSRSVGGIPALFAARWIKANCPRTRLKVEKHLKDVHPQFELACEYAQKVYLPLPLADIANDVIEHKEAHPSDIRRLMLDAQGDAHTPSDWEDKKQGERKGVNSSSVDDDKRFKELKLVIKRPVKQPSPVSDGTSKKRRAIQSVEKFRKEPGHSTLIRLFSDWAIKLLGPSANKRNGKKLTEETVAKYLHHAWVPLSTVLAGGKLSNFGEEELYELLSSALEFDPALSQASNSTKEISADDEDTSIDQARALNRLFEEMSGRYALPQFRFRGVGDSKSNIDAGFITNAEQRVIENTFSEWSRDPQLKADLKKPTLQLRTLSYLYKATGLRRNEALHLQENDLATSGTTSLRVRWHQQNSIKTKASNRFLSLDEALPVRGNATTEKIFDGVHRQPNQTTLLTLVGSTIQTVTGSPHGRIHHYRHTKGTEAVFVGFTLQDPIERIRFLSAAVADLGHASIRTTLGFYSHMSHHAVAIRQARDVDELANYQIAGILEKSDNAINALRNRSSAGRPMLTGIIPKTKTPATRPQEPIDLPEALKPKSNESNLDRLMWLYRFGNGESAQAAAATNNINIKALKQLLEATILVAKKTKWSPIEADRLQAELHNLTDSTAMYQGRTAKHRVFPEEAFLPLIADVQLTDELAEKTKAAVGGLSLRSNSELLWVLSDAEVNSLHVAWERSNLQMTLRPTTGCRDQFSIEALGVPTAKHSTNCVRLLLFFLLLLTELRAVS